jgi:hypothetical protein
MPLVTAILYTLTLFLSATLLFVVQPLVGKQLLPVLGGTPAVWNACLVFFQGALLLGYFYVHGLRKLPPRGQLLVHGLMLGAAFLTLTLREPLQANLANIPTDSDFPAVKLLLVLAVMVGLPFMALSATAPLLQNWYAIRGSTDPYFLYAASNVGSLLGLLGYPFIVEQQFDLDDQRRLWAWGFGLVAGLMLLCGVLVKQGSAVAATAAAYEPVRRALWWKWVFLAALPSSWLLAVTTHLTTDIAPVPLLWVVPLAIYLLSFVLVFAWWPEFMRFLLGRSVPMVLMFLIIAWLTHATEPISIIAAIHLVALAGVALLCHGELAASRPPATQLTSFYLALSVGGVLGGLFNAVLAPMIFSKLGLLEYPLVMVLIAFVRPDIPQWSFQRRDVLYLLAWGLFTLVLNLVVPRLLPAVEADDPNAMLVRLGRVGLTLGLPVIVLFALVWNPVRFAIGLLLLMLIGQLSPSQTGETLLIARNFFGTLRITRSTDGQFYSTGARQHPTWPAEARRSRQPQAADVLLPHRADWPLVPEASGGTQTAGWRGGARLRSPRRLRGTGPNLDLLRD